MLAVSSPLSGATVCGLALPVTWSTVGAPATRFTIAIDGRLVKEHIAGTHAEVPLDGLAPGPHILTVIAEGACTRYRLSRTELDDPLENPIPVRVDEPFVVE